MNSPMLFHTWSLFFISNLLLPNALYYNSGKNRLKLKIRSNQIDYASFVIHYALDEGDGNL